MMYQRTWSVVEKKEKRYQSGQRCVLMQLSHISYFFRDGKPSVADYNSTLMGVVVVVVVALRRDGIT